MRTNVCPRCGSGEVAVGNSAKECFACGWHYLNTHACRVCGLPARGVIGCGGVTYYRCADHTFSEAEFSEVMNHFVRLFKELPR